MEWRLLCSAFSPSLPLSLSPSLTVLFCLFDRFLVFLLPYCCCCFCSLQTATGTADEIQAVDCLCGSGCAGTFRLSFRNELTPSIAYGASASDVKTALESLRTIVSVTVTFEGGSAPCDADGSSTRITFTHQSGDLPSLKLSSSLTQSSGTPTINIKVDGT